MERISSTVYIETGYPGVNVGAIVTDQGVVCIDAPSRPRDAQDWLARIHWTIGEPVRYLILTDYQGDRVFCGSTLQRRSIAHLETKDVLQSYAARYPSPVLENIALRYSLTRRELNGTPVIHPEVSFCHQAALQLGSHRIDLLHVPGATRGTTWVHVKQDGVLFVGDTLVINEHPPLAEAETSSWLSALARLRQGDLEGEIIVPGRGPFPEQDTVAALTAFIQLALDRVCSLYRAGRPRSETSALIPELLDVFPPPAPETEATMEWLQKQLKAGLDHLYDECKADISGR
jgi:glyoxylase-like metal-dependent hydrolase (beta-lactamase superfamily II)